MDQPLCTNSPTETGFKVWKYWGTTIPTGLPGLWRLWFTGPYPRAKRPLDQSKYVAFYLHLWRWNPHLPFASLARVQRFRALPGEPVNRGLGVDLQVALGAKGCDALDLAPGTLKPPSPAEPEKYVRFVATKVFSWAEFRPHRPPDSHQANKPSDPQHSQQPPGNADGFPTPSPRIAEPGEDPGPPAGDERGDHSGHRERHQGRDNRMPQASTVSHKGER